MPYRALLSLLLLPALHACDAGSPCDPDQRFEQSVCLDERPAASGSDGGGAAGADADVPLDADVPPDAGVPLDAGADAAVDAGAGCPEAVDDALGVDCSTELDCGCAAPYCAVMPGQAIGYCTTRDCQPGGDDCPDGYQCFDLSGLGVMGLPTFCVPQ